MVDSGKSHASVLRTILFVVLSKHQGKMVTSRIYTYNGTYLKSIQDLRETAWFLNILAMAQ